MTDAAYSVEVTIYHGAGSQLVGKETEYAGDLTGTGKPQLFVYSTEDLKLFVLDTIIIDPRPPAKVVS